MQKKALSLAFLSILGSWCYAKKTEADCANDSFPLPPCCGGRQFKTLMTYKSIKSYEHPWIAHINITQILDNGAPKFCGGTLINSRWVLSVAHCFKTPKIQLQTPVTLYLGETSKPVTVDIEKIFPHEKYDPNSKDPLNDIALLHLSRPVSFNKAVQPICLPWNKKIDKRLTNVTLLEVAGWGRTHLVENKNNMPARLKATVEISTKCKKGSKVKKICTSGVLEIDSCLGDSGGSLITLDAENDKKPYYQLGLVAHKEPCDKSGKPFIYTKIFEHVNWIKRTIKNNS